MLYSFKPVSMSSRILSNYCMNLTNHSIRKMTEKYNLERNELKIKNPFAKQEDDPNNNDNNNNHNDFFYGFLLLISISSYVFFFHKRIKE